MHALIVGPRGVGKSTLICRVLEELKRPLFGFETKKEDALADAAQGSPVYIYEAGKPHLQSEENRIGYCGYRQPGAAAAAFERFAPKLRQYVPEGCLIKLDEIGFLETGSEAFCGAVMALLDGNIPVIAAVKDKDIPFLEKVRSHPNARCFYITPENRDRLFEDVLEFMKSQIEDVAWHEKH